VSGGAALNWTCADRLHALVHMFDLPKPNVVVYGLLPSEWYGRWLLPYKTDQEGRVYFFQEIDNAVGMHESDASLFILPFEAGATITTKGHPASAPLASCDQTLFAALCKVVPLTLQRGALVCFLIRPNVPVPYFSQARVPEYKRNDTLSRAEIDALLNFHDNIIGHRLLEEAQVRIEPSFLLETDIRSRVGEVSPFLKKYAATKFRMRPMTGSFGEGTTALATFGDDDVAGIVREIERGMLFWLPVRNPTGEEDCIGAMETLSRCLFTFRSKTLGDEPGWVSDQFLWMGEDDMRQQRAQAQQTLEATASAVERFARLRRILWTRDTTLQAEVVWFLEEMGLSVEGHERYKEDFWIMLDGERLVIGEIKAVNSNVTPSDLAHVVSHRKEAGKPDEFPALFVANTFASTEEIDKRRIEPNVCRRAREDNVLLMRTVDLARFYDGMMKKLEGFDLDTLWTQLRSGGGWLQVEADRASLRTA
jgi:hypothetical protein